MPTLEQAIEKFQMIYNIPVDFKTMETEVRKFSFLDNNLFETNKKNSEIEYQVCLDHLLHTYIDSKTNMTAGKAEYDLSDFNIAKFINDYEEMMAVKNAQNPNRKPYEGLSQTIIGEAVESLKSYDKPLSDIWADKVTKNKMTFEDFAAFANAENDFVMSNLNKENKETLKQRAENVYIAKKAMDKIWKDRSIFWIIIHPVQAVQEYNYKNTLNNCLVNLHSQGFYSPKRFELTSTSMMRAPFEAAAKASVKKIHTNKIEKSKVNSVLNKKAATWNDSNKLRADDEFVNETQKQIFDTLNKYPEGIPKTATANSAYSLMSLYIDKFWGSFNESGANKDSVLQTCSYDMFKKVYTAFEDSPGINTLDKIIAAQKIANLTIATLSPAASDDKYAEYADNYFLKNATPESIKEITGYDGNAQELLNSARFELGIDDKLQMNLTQEVNNNQKNIEVTDQINPSELVKSQTTLVE